MTVTPAAPLASGAGFTVAVAYKGRPRPIGGIGWIKTHDGTTVFSEPNGSPGWFPCNDHPLDKASYSFTVTVPRRYRAIANGLLDSVQRHGGATTFAWHEPEPMATYLATVTIGHFRIKRSGIDGLPSWTAVAPGEGRRSRRSLRRLPRVIRFLSDRFGAYPFSSAGRSSFRARARRHSRHQTRPVYLGAPFTEVVAHETGAPVVRRLRLAGPVAGHLAQRGLRDLDPMALADAGGADGKMRSLFTSLYRSKRTLGYPGFWKLPPGAPGPKKLFSAAVYFRGGLTLEALREKLGDATFFGILRDWVARHRYGNGTTQQFIALAEADSGVSLSQFFDAWLFQPRKPQSW